MHGKPAFLALLTATLGTILAVTGCANSFAPTLSPATAELGTSAFAGKVNGGQPPIGYAHVYMYAADTTGYGNASQSLLVAAPGTRYPTTADSNGNYYMTTDATGNWYVSAGEYACSAGQQVYMYALGGDPGSGTNTAASLMAVLGQCGQGGTFAGITNVVINEAATMAAAFALSGFATDSTHVSSGPSTQAKLGLANAFANAAQMYNVNNGVAGALAKTPNGYGAVPQPRLNALANTLAACVNTKGPTSSQCVTLFSNAQSAGSTGTIPTDTATAAINIAHNPANAVGTLFMLAGSSVPFTPTLMSAPNDWTMGITFSGNGLTAPNDVAVDDSGNIWVTGTDSASKLTSLGTPVTGSPFAVPGANYVAIGSADEAFITSNDGGLYKLSASGANQSGSPFITANVPQGTGVVADSYFVYVVNTVDSNYYQLSYGGAPQGYSPYTFAPCTNGLIHGAEAGGYTQWGSSPSTNTVCNLNTSWQVGTFTGFSTPERIAADHAASAWVANHTGNSVSQITSGGTVTSFTGGGLSSPFGVAVDGNGAIWLANQGNNTVSQFSNSGAAVSAGGGYTGGTLSTPTNLAVDPSGNLWVTNGAADTVVELIGAATPTVTPLATGVSANTLGTRP